MPRLTFEEPLAGPTTKEPTEDRQDGKRDGVVVVLKAATFAVVIALVGAVVLLLTAGEDKPRAKTPDVPEIKSTGAPAPTSTTPPAAIVVPQVGSETAVMSKAPTTTTPTTQPTEPPRGRDERFVSVGKPCDTPGAYAFTKRYEPVLCTEPGPVWRPMLR